jgi:hypothetical protein
VTLNSLETIHLIAGLIPAGVNHKILHFDAYFGFSRCDGSSGGASERLFIHMLYITMQTTGGDDGYG